MITLKKHKNVSIKGVKYKYRIKGADIKKSDLAKCDGLYYCYEHSKKNYPNGVWFQNKSDAQRLYLKYVNTEEI